MTEPSKPGQYVVLKSKSTGECFYSAHSTFDEEMYEEVGVADTHAQARALLPPMLETLAEYNWKQLLKIGGDTGQAFRSTAELLMREFNSPEVVEQALDQGRSPPTPSDVQRIMLKYVGRNS